MFVELVVLFEIDDLIWKNVLEILVYFYEEGVDLKVIFGDNLFIVFNIVRCVGLLNYDVYIDFF